MPVIGYFSGRSPEAEAPIRTPFLKALEASGFTVRSNVAIEYRFAEGQDDLLPLLVAELVRRQVAMLVATDRPSAVAAKAATETIPIVFTSGFDPAWASRQHQPAGWQRDRCEFVHDRTWAKAPGSPP
jgi:putative ABC transport system substrate-binding protein